MDLKIKGKKALVTGSTEGIGLAIAKELGKEGATVYINGRKKEKVEKIITSLQKEIPSGNFQDASFDLGSSKGIEDLISKIPHLDLLINNVGIYEEKPFFKITDEDWLHFFEVNVLSGIRLSRAFLPKMIRNNWGRIIFISSESAVNIPEEMIHYGTTKTAQLAVSRGLAELTKGTKVTVNSILPGPTYSTGVKDFVKDLAESKNQTKEKMEEEFFQTMRPSSLLQRFATPEEVAALVVFVCSENAAAINGASLRVDGGIVRSII